MKKCRMSINLVEGSPVGQYCIFFCFFFVVSCSLYFLCGCGCFCAHETSGCLLPTLNALPDVARRMVELPLTRCHILGELSIPIDGLQAPPHQDMHDVTTRHLWRLVAGSGAKQATCLVVKKLVKLVCMAMTVTVLFMSCALHGCCSEWEIDNRFNRSPTCLSAFAEEELLNRLWGCEVAAKGQHCADIGETDAYTVAVIRSQCPAQVAYLSFWQI